MQNIYKNGVFHHPRLMMTSATKTLPYQVYT